MDKSALLDKLHSLFKEKYSYFHSLEHILFRIERGENEWALSIFKSELDKFLMMDDAEALLREILEYPVDNSYFRGDRLEAALRTMGF